MHRSTKQEILHLQRNWQSYFTLCGEEAIPKKIKDATIIHVFKRKGNPQVCDNHRGMSLLSIAGKILARVLLNRLNKHLEQSELLPVWIQKRQRNNRHDLYSTIVSRKMPGTECGPQQDLCRSYQSIWHSREGLWKIIAKFGCSAKFIAMMRQFYDGMLARVQNDGFFLIHSLWQMELSKAVTGFNTVQHDVFCHAYRCLSG